MAVKIEKIEFAGWKNCVKLADEKTELIITTDVGPRIISARANGGENMLCVVEDDAGKVGGDKWRNYGGHRLWHAPEDFERTYVPDNTKVDWSKLEEGISLCAETEKPTGIQKQMEITLADGQVKINHRLTNLGLWPVELSVWALSVMAAGGLEIMPLPSKGKDLLPSYSLGVWPYTNLCDKRLYLGKKYITLKQEKGHDGPAKIGYSSEHGWAAYCLNGDLFIKRFPVEHCSGGLPYPDFGCSYETYTCEFMTEMESLSRMCRLNPGESKDHWEIWDIYRGVERPAPDDEAMIDKLVEKYIG